jgi:hypothetical protein
VSSDHADRSSAKPKTSVKRTRLPLRREFEILNVLAVDEFRPSQSDAIPDFPLGFSESQSVATSCNCIVLCFDVPLLLLDRSAALDANADTPLSCIHILRTSNKRKNTILHRL